VTYADDLVVLIKEETVLRIVIDRLIETERWYLMEKNEEKSKVM
jgi:Reverse transcriptase (RNA-dependent DNA polymerase).